MQIIFFSNKTKNRISINLGKPVMITLMGSVLLIACGLFYAGVQFATQRTAEILYSIRAQTTATWEDVLVNQSQLLAETQVAAEKSLDALSGRLSTLQGHVMRLDALGSRLAEMADIEDMDFSVDNHPGIGGPQTMDEQESVDVADFIASLQSLEIKLQDRSEKLAAMETMLINRSLQEMTLPAGNPAAKGWLSSLYGYRTDPITGKKEFHEGLDFAGNPGTPIAAVAAGIVTWSGPLYGYGNLVEISHGGGYITRYAHNKNNLVTVGDKVDKGEVIAVMGSSGRSTGTHVHFEVIRNGKQVNPREYVVSK
jgi:murein DD-endopeptidase MepM/ murein hydrolase activator NlpD